MPRTTPKQLRQQSCHGPLVPSWVLNHIFTVNVAFEKPHIVEQCVSSGATLCGKLLMHWPGASDNQRQRQVKAGAWAFHYIPTLPRVRPELR